MMEHLDLLFRFKAAIMHEGRPKIVFTREDGEDVEITIDDDGLLAFRKSTVPFEIVDGKLQVSRSEIVG